MNAYKIFTAFWILLAFCLTVFQAKRIHKGVSIFKLFDEEGVNKIFFKNAIISTVLMIILLIVWTALFKP